MQTRGNSIAAAVMAGAGAPSTPSYAQANGVEAGLRRHDGAAHRAGPAGMNKRPILLIALLLGTPAGCGAPRTNASGASANASTPGWTGRTVIPGSTSTVAGDAAATEQQQKWQLGPSR